MPRGDRSPRASVGQARKPDPHSEKWPSAANFWRRSLLDATRRYRRKIWRTTWLRSAALNDTRTKLSITYDDGLLRRQSPTRFVAEDRAMALEPFENVPTSPIFSHRERLMIPPTPSENSEPTIEALSLGHPGGCLPGDPADIPACVTKGKAPDGENPVSNWPAKLALR